MKGKLILPALLMVTHIASAQPWISSGSYIYNNPTLTTAVGIGTATPVYKLEVKTNSSAGFDDGIYLNNSGNSSNPSIYLHNTNNGSSSKNWSMKAISITGGTDWVLRNETDGLDAIHVTPQGRLGIGANIGSVNGKVHVVANSETFSIKSENISGSSGFNNCYGVGSYVIGNPGTNTLTRGFLADAYNANENQGAYLHAYTGSVAKGVEAHASGASVNNYGGYFDADGKSLSNTVATGVYAIARDAPLSTGVQGMSEGINLVNYGGVFGSIFNSNPTNIASWNIAANATRINIGVVGSGSAVFTGLPQTYTSLPQANIGIYGTACVTGMYSQLNQDWGGWFDDDVYVNGFTLFTNTWAVSDRKFKKNIETIDDATGLISKLRPGTYLFNVENEYGMHFGKEKQYGFISQDVETVLPELVKDMHKPAGVDKDGKEITKAVDYKALNYIGFIALLTKGMQEQQSQIEKLDIQIAGQQKQIDELKALVRSLADKDNIGLNSTNVNLGDKNTVVLDQNVPNPFAESTVITYNIPAGSGKAQIVFSTINGQLVKAIDIDRKGAGSLTVFANDLTTGVYTYTLMVEGKAIDTKRMVKQ